MPIQIEMERTSNCLLQLSGKKILLLLAIMHKDYTLINQTFINFNLEDIYLKIDS